MTCIVGVEFKGRVYMGGDGSSMSGDSQSRISEPKVWKNNGVIFGCCGDLYALQHLKHVTDWPRYQSQKVEKFLAKQLCPTFRKSLKALHDQFPDNNENPEAGLLVGVGGHLYEIDSAGAYTEVGHAYAVGSGGECARAVLFHTVNEDPEERITAALEAAEAVCVSVCEPFTILSA